MFHTVLMIGDMSLGSDRLFKLMSSEFAFCVRTHGVSSNLLLHKRQLGGFSTIVLYPADVFPPLPDETQRTLAEFVSDGGVLVCLPFTAWSATHRGNSILGSILPVHCTEFYEGQSVRLDRKPNDWRLHREEVFERDYVLSGEMLELKPGAELDVSCRVSGTKNVLTATASHGKGEVRYLNANHHGDDVSAIADLWTQRSWQDGAYAPFSSLLNSLLANKSHAGLMLPEILHRMTFEMTQFDGYQDPFLPSSRHRAASFISHYSGRNDIRNDPEAILAAIIPTRNDFASMSQAERYATCRAMTEVVSILADFDESPESDDTAEGENYVQYSLARMKEIVSPQKAGEIYELYCEFVFQLVPGLTPIQSRRRTRTGEVDILLRNESVNPFIKSLGETIPVECKFRSESVGAKELRDFAGKLDELCATSGFLVSDSGLSGPGDRNAQLLLRDIGIRGKSLVALNRDDLRDLCIYLESEEILRRAKDRALDL